MTEIIVCSCESCKKGDYNPEDYVVTDEHFLRLDKERPFGITGHLRIKNEALTLAKCIESVVNVLDEIIITYDKSKDNTREIALEYSARYPDKIRFFDYKPFVAPHGRLGREESNRFHEKSIHNAANYYNYGLVKTSYKYYMKVDGDQIYFTDKLKRFKNILARVEKSKPGQYPDILKRTGRFCIRFTQFGFKLLPRFFSRLISSDFWFFLFGFFNYPAFSYSLAGINVYFKHGEYVCGVKPLAHNGGVGDTVIWIVNSNSRYRWDLKKHTQVISVPRIIHSGFFWVHYKYIKIYHSIQHKKIKHQIVPVDSLLKISKPSRLLADETGQKYLPSLPSTFQKNLLMIFAYAFWNDDKKYIPSALLPVEKVEEFIRLNENHNH